VRDLVPITNYFVDRKTDLVGALVNASLHTNAALPASNGKNEHYLRSLIPFDERGLTGDKQRPGTDRHNPYWGPSELLRVGKEGLRASDCRNVGNPSPPLTIGSGAPPCVVQPGWDFLGKTAYFPHLQALPPAK
jgi:hypothetical protein